VQLPHDDGFHSAVQLAKFCKKKYMVKNGSKSKKLTVGALFFQFGPVFSIAKRKVGLRPIFWEDAANVSPLHRRSLTNTA
jgi:hypothetical protein